MSRREELRARFTGTGAKKPRTSRITAREYDEIQAKLRARPDEIENIAAEHCLGVTTIEKLAQKSGARK
jgi:hypothetical protein